MKKQILNLGKALSKAEQKLVNGGSNGLVCCATCPDGTCNSWAISLRACTFTPQGECN